MHIGSKNRAKITLKFPHCFRHFDIKRSNNKFQERYPGRGGGRVGKSMGEFFKYGNKDIYVFLFYPLPSSFCPFSSSDQCGGGGGLPRKFLKGQHPICSPPEYTPDYSGSNMTQTVELASVGPLLLLRPPGLDVGEHRGQAILQSQELLVLALFSSVSKLLTL